MNKIYGWYLSFSLLKTAVIACLLTYFTFKLITPAHTAANSDFEVMENDDMNLNFEILWMIVLTLSSLTCLLNLIENIRSKPLYRILSFFLLPGVLALTLIGYSHKKEGMVMATLLASTFIFFITLIFFYFRFLAYTKNDRYN